MTRIIAIANQKGGVGKSATTYHLARAAGQAGLHTLVIDADPQGNTTRSLTDAWSPGDLSLADVLAPGSSTTLREVLVPGRDAAVSVVPSGRKNLAAVEQLLVGVNPGRESCLRVALAQVAQDYELVLIDCNPSINLLTTNALVAATHALAIIRLNEFAMDGFGELHQSLDAIRTYYNPLLRLVGVQVNGYEPWTTQAKFWLPDLQDQAAAAAIPVLEPFIPERTVISEAIERRLSLAELGARGREVAPLYDQLLTTITTEA